MTVDCEPWEDSFLLLPYPQQPAHCLARSRPLRSDGRMSEPHPLPIALWCLRFFVAVSGPLSYCVTNLGANISSHVLTMMAPIFQMGKLRLRESKLPVQGQVSCLLNPRS